jgi:hypothetical protein
MWSTGAMAFGESSVATVMSIVWGESWLAYVTGVPHCSQNCRKAGAEDAYERKAPVTTLKVSRGTVAQATACAPEARRHDSQWQKQGGMTGAPHS